MNSTLSLFSDFQLFIFTVNSQSIQSENHYSEMSKYLHCFFFFHFEINNKLKVTNCKRWWVCLMPLIKTDSMWNIEWFSIKTTIIYLFLSNTPIWDLYYMVFPLVITFFRVQKACFCSEIQHQTQNSLNYNFSSISPLIFRNFLILLWDKKKRHQTVGMIWVSKFVNGNEYTVTAFVL